MLGKRISIPTYMVIFSALVISGCTSSPRHLSVKNSSGRDVDDVEVAFLGSGVDLELTTLRIDDLTDSFRFRFGFLSDNKRKSYWPIRACPESVLMEWTADGQSKRGLVQVPDRIRKVFFQSDVGELFIEIQPDESLEVYMQMDGATKSQEIR